MTERRKGCYKLLNQSQRGPMKSTIDLHLTQTDANIGVREIKLLDRIRVFLSVPVHCT